MHVVLPMEIDDAKFQYFIDKAFETVKGQSNSAEKYFMYDEAIGEAKLYTRDDIIQQEMKKSDE